MQSSTREEVLANSAQGKQEKERSCNHENVGQHSKMQGMNNKKIGKLAAIKELCVCAVKRTFGNFDLGPIPRD